MLTANGIENKINYDWQILGETTNNHLHKHKTLKHLVLCCSALDSREGYQANVIIQRDSNALFIRNLKTLVNSMYSNPQLQTYSNILLGKKFPPL